MRVLIWATTLQADILALALHLDAREDVSLMVVAEGAAAYLRTPIARARPIAAPLLERHARPTREAVVRFAPDVVVCDNHFPGFAAAPRVCSMWHGLGWKVRPAADLPSFYSHIERLTRCDPRRPNPRFMAQCYAESDRRERVEHWGLAPENCHVLGMALSDLLRAPPYRKEDLVDHYRIDIGARKTLLLNITWHYGRIFPGRWQPGAWRTGWWRGSDVDADLRFIARVFEHARDLDANVLFCMHDRKRYEASYLKQLHDLSRRFSHVELRHKDEHPDNLADLLVADAMVSNMSSFTGFMYLLERPTVHICPSQDHVRFARMRLGRLTAGAENTGYAWRIVPTDNGGLTTYAEDDTLAAIDRALREPDCCRDKTRDFLARHLWKADGHTCARIGQALQALVDA